MYVFGTHGAIVTVMDFLTAATPIELQQSRLKVVVPATVTGIFTPETGFPPVPFVAHPAIPVVEYPVQLPPTASVTDQLRSMLPPPYRRFVDVAVKVVTGAAGRAQPLTYAYVPVQLL